ncbi:hypothetical protein BGY98DRAFT_1030061 [Russula aff. rugulosa BPL654]|nr:hypothetical protein BGY98DRAFT_1030061 [Russula aff. rugulosa BPL654]
MVRISTVIESSAAPHHRQIHPNADVNPIARKLPTNNINAFDSQDETRHVLGARFKAQRVARRTTTNDG